MVKPSAKRSVVNYLKSTFDLSINQGTELAGMSRSNWYYRSRINDEELITKLRELAASHPTRGFDYYYHLIRREGYKWARSRFLRVYRSLGLVRRAKKRRKLPLHARKPLVQPARLNEIWSMDFMSDSLEEGRKFRVLNVIDDCNRACLINKGGISFPSQKVTRILDEIASERGYPKYIRTDNGPEFISKDYKDWCRKRNVIPVYSSPGKPMENGYVERFNRTFREDILDAYLFSSIAQFNLLAEEWAQNYNEKHPHKSLGRKSPNEFGASLSLLSGQSPNNKERDGDITKVVQL